MDKTVKRIKLGCYGANTSMAIVSNMPPLLFLTFRELYGISYSLLGLLVLVNFVTQLGIDLMFSFFSHKFNIERVIKITPLFTVSGLAIYALSPIIFGDATYVGLIIGTVIFSAASGFAEVLISPLIAALPADNPEHEMSKLHSVYAWGSVAVIAISTLFLFVFDNKYWQILIAILIIVPIFAILMLWGVKLPELETPKDTSQMLSSFKNPALWLCVLAIFLGGASECTMAQWASSYLEGAVGIPKLVGDIFGVALFGLMLGVGRTLYSKRGKNIQRVLLFGALGAFICYTVAAVSQQPILAVIACALTGLCTSMLWPGSLIVAEKRIPGANVLVYAMMAAGGDLGASIGPQLLGIITDTVSASSSGKSLADTLGITAEALGMKFGLLIGAIFPLLAAFVFLYVLKTSKKQNSGL